MWLGTPCCPPHRTCHLLAREPAFHPTAPALHHPTCLRAAPRGQLTAHGPQGGGASTPPRPSECGLRMPRSSTRGVERRPAGAGREPRPGAGRWAACTHRSACGNRGPHARRPRPHPTAPQQQLEQNRWFLTRASPWQPGTRPLGEGGGAGPAALRRRDPAASRRPGRQTGDPAVPAAHARARHQAGDGDHGPEPGRAAPAGLSGLSLDTGPPVRRGGRSERPGGGGRGSGVGVRGRGRSPGSGSGAAVRGRGSAVGVRGQEQLSGPGVRARRRECARAVGPVRLRRRK